MNRFLPTPRFALLNLMAAVVVLAITCAVVARSARSRVRPVYEAGAWVYCRSLVHDAEAHAVLEREARSEPVLAAALADPAISALPRFHGRSDPQSELARAVRVEVHPVYEWNDRFLVRGLETVRISVESGSEQEAAMVTDVVAAAFCKVLGPARCIRMLKSAVPGGTLRRDDSLLDAPWKLIAAVIVGTVVSAFCLIMPLGKRSRPIAVMNRSP